jgi:hypothetical protein
VCAASPTKPHKLRPKSILDVGCTHQEGTITSLQDQLTKYVGKLDEYTGQGEINKHGKETEKKK